MDSFQGSDGITIQPGSSAVPYRFVVTVASSSTLNDGQLPHGSSMVSFTVTAHKSNGSTAYGSGELISGSTLWPANTMMVRLSYSSNLSCPGLYHLTFKACATVRGSTGNLFYKELDFNRVRVVDR